MKTTFVAAWLAVMLTGAVTPAHAGRSCEQRPLTATSLERGLSLAERTAKALDGSGARVAVLARAGQDLSRYGLAWSHLGLAYRDPGSGHWRVVHKLNHCATADRRRLSARSGRIFPGRSVALRGGVRADQAGIRGANRRGAAR